MVPPETKSMAGLNTRTGVTVAPCAVEPTVMEVNVIAPVTAAASKAVEAVVSALVDMVKPPVVSGRAPPRVSPVRVIALAAVPRPATGAGDPAIVIVITIKVLAAVAAGLEEPVTAFPLTGSVVMLPTVPKK